MSSELGIHLLETFQHYYYMNRSFYHHLLMPPIREIISELSFRDGQIEADGLSRICAQIWTASWLLVQSWKESSVEEQAALSTLRLFLGLAWEAERAAEVNNRFYPYQQLLYLQLSPILQRLQEYCGSRSEFYSIDNDIQPRKNRPFDDLYISPQLELRGKISLMMYQKGRGNTVTATDCLRLDAKERFEIIHYFLRDCTTCVAKIADGINEHTTLATSGSRRTDSYTNVTVKTAHVDMQEFLLSLRKLIDEVQLSRGMLSEIYECAESMVESANNYLVGSQWVCDRVAEISSMTRLCYNYVVNRLFSEAPQYPRFAPLPKIKPTVASLEFIFRKKSKKVITEPSKTEFVNDAMSKGIGFVRHAKLIVAAKSKAAAAAKNELKMRKVEDFYCTEYHDLLMRLFLYVGRNKSLRFKRGSETRFHD